MMTTQTVTLANAFLEHFNYCDDAGKRKNTSWFMRLFFNHHLTARLEKLAVDTVTKIRSIRDQSHEDKTERIEAIKQCLSESIESAYQLRLQYGHTKVAIYGQDFQGKPLIRSDTVRPKKQGQFESMLMNALQAMKNVQADFNALLTKVTDNAARVERVTIAR